MFIAFLPRLEAQEILEREYETQANRAEIEAELGSSYFFNGLSSWEASFQAKLDLDAREADYLASPDGQHEMAEVEAAQFMASATRDLDVVTLEEINDPRIFIRVGATVVPEFYPDGPRKGLFYTTDSSLNNEDIPF